jgi:hypothetical protein
MEDMRRRTIILLLACIAAVMLAACGSSEFQKVFNKFKEIYISANDFTDGMTGEIDDIVRAIDLDEYEESFNTLKADLDVMKSIASTEEEKNQCNTADSNLEDMEFILYARKNIDHLTEDEERNLWNSILWVNGDRYCYMEGLD